jgi:superfamily II DNA or RNA helicase
MSKAILSNKLYLENIKDSDKKKELLSTLTYPLESTQFKSNTKTAKVIIEYLKNYQLLSNGVIAIPSGRVDLLPEGYTLEDRRIEVPVVFPNPKFPLRPSQQEVIDQITGSCILNAKVGWGKTYSALHIAHKLGNKTLVVVHTSALRNQWVNEVKSLFGIEPGIIGGGVVKYEGYPIVIGNIQTLSKHKAELSKVFGTVIVDEVHRLAADTFKDFLEGMYSKHRIGLSGTLTRKDGKHVILPDLFGPVLFKPAVDNTVDPIINIVKSGIYLSYDEVWTKKINNLLYDPDYQEFIAKLAKMQIDKGHSVLIIASRVEFLTKVKELLGETCLLVTGNTTDVERDAVKKAINSGTHGAIAGSRQIFSEGVSIDRLSAAILAEPIAQHGLCEQIIGRIMRPWPEKLTPEVFDINYADRPSSKQNNLRLQLYLEKGWQIKTY